MRLPRREHAWKAGLLLAVALLGAGVGVTVIRDDAGNRANEASSAEASPETTGPTTTTSTTTSTTTTTEPPTTTTIPEEQQLGEWLEAWRPAWSRIADFQLAIDAVGGGQQAVHDPSVNAVLREIAADLVAGLDSAGWAPPSYIEGSGSLRRDAEAMVAGLDAAAPCAPITTAVDVDLVVTCLEAFVDAIDAADDFDLILWQMTETAGVDGP